MSEQYLRDKKLNKVTFTAEMLCEAYLVISIQSMSVFFIHSFMTHKTVEDLFVAERQKTHSETHHV